MSEEGDKGLGVLGIPKALNQLLKRLFFQGDVYTPLWNFHPGHSVRVKRTKLCRFCSSGYQDSTALCAGMCAQHCLCHLWHLCAHGKAPPAYRVARHWGGKPQQSPFDPAGMRGLIWC